MTSLFCRNCLRMAEESNHLSCCMINFCWTYELILSNLRFKNTSSRTVGVVFVFLLSFTASQLSHSLSTLLYYDTKASDRKDKNSDYFKITFLYCTPDLPYTSILYRDASNSMFALVDYSPVLLRQRSPTLHEISSLKYCAVETTKNSVSFFIHFLILQFYTYICAMQPLDRP